MTKWAATGSDRYQRGVVLMLVLWVLALLSVVTAEFCRSMRTEANIASNHLQMAEAYYTAVGGMHLGFYQIIDKIANPSSRTGSRQTREDLSTDPSQQWRINTELPTVTAGKGTAHLRIDNEAGRININLAGPAIIGLALNGLGLSEEEQSIIVDSILDWRDTDDFHRLNGAETDYYKSLPEPYECKNDAFDSVEELMRVRGVSAELFHGGLSQRVTVYPSLQAAKEHFGWPASAKNPQPDVFLFDKININAVSPAVLAALPGFDQVVVDTVVAYRQDKDIASASDLVMVAGGNAYVSAMPYLTWALSPYYRVSAVGLIQEGTARRGISAIVRIDLNSKTKYTIVQWFDQAGGNLLR